jgi:threonylcarbamoyladenosine tRNA methylthiotransferase MtaB
LASAAWRDSFQISSKAQVRCYYSTVASFYVQNFGCRATQADGAAIERQFEDQGLERAGAASEAEVVVLNTCTVTASADQDARAAIRRVHRENPQARIVVTGCYAQRSPEELAALPGVSKVIGNSHKHQLAQITLNEDKEDSGHGFVSVGTLTAKWDSSQRRVLACPGPSEGTDDQRPGSHQRPIFVSDIFAHTELLAAPVFDAPNERTRPNLKIQDGCDNRCSFCVIPYVRGQSRSMKKDQILQEVNTLVAAGYRELVISGINLGRWGKDLEAGDRSQRTGDRFSTESVSTTLAIERFSQRPTTDDQRPNSRREFRFEDLITAILEHSPLEKLRISSVEPMDWTDELIALVASSPRIAKHVHVPMQSGSDAVLRRMHRKYRPWHYREKIEKIRSAMPDAAVGADVMVGFPGESHAEFEETRWMIEELPFTYLHVFTYSARPGTPAAGMPHQVPLPVARERSRILRELGEQKKLAFMRSFLGKTVEAITLAGRCGADTPVRDLRTGHFTEALTDNYLKLRLNGEHISNLWVHAQVRHIENQTLIADPV